MTHQDKLLLVSSHEDTCPNPSIDQQAKSNRQFAIGSSRQERRKAPGYADERYAIWLEVDRKFDWKYAATKARSGTWQEEYRPHLVEPVTVQGRAVSIVGVLHGNLSTRARAEQEAVVEYVTKNAGDILFETGLRNYLKMDKGSETDDHFLYGILGGGSIALGSLAAELDESEQIARNLTKPGSENPLLRPGKVSFLTYKHKLGASLARDYEAIMQRRAFTRFEETLWPPVSPLNIEHYINLARSKVQAQAAAKSVEGLDQGRQLALVLGDGHVSEARRFLENSKYDPNLLLYNLY